MQEEKNKLPELNFPQIQGFIMQMQYQLKTQQKSINKLKQEIQLRTTETFMTEMFMKIQMNINLDANITKLLKLAQNTVQKDLNNHNNDSNDNNNMNSNKYSSLRIAVDKFIFKTNEIVQAESILMKKIKDLEYKCIGIQNQSKSMINEKIFSIQQQIQDIKMEKMNDNITMSEKIDSNLFETIQQIRNLQNKTQWTLNEYKSKLSEKLSQNTLRIQLDNFRKQQTEKLKEIKQEIDINPQRIDSIEKIVKQHSQVYSKGLTNCELKFNEMNNIIEKQLMKVQNHQKYQINYEKRMIIFNSNIKELFERMKNVEKKQINTEKILNQLNNQTKNNKLQLIQINNILNNFSIDEDFQNMLQQINPDQVLRLFVEIKDIKSHQSVMIKQLKAIQREMGQFNGKNQVQGVKIPNQQYKKISREEIQEAMGNFLEDHQFAKKITSIQSMVLKHQASTKVIDNIWRKLARLEKENNYEKVLFQLKAIQQYIKAEILKMKNKCLELQWKNQFHNSAKNRNTDKNKINLSTKRLSHNSLKRMEAIHSLTSSKHYL